MIRYVKDTAMASGNPAGTGNPFQKTPRLESMDAVVLDNTAGNFAVVGKVLVEQITAANGIGGASGVGAGFVQSAAATQALGTWHLGVVVSPAGANANNASGLPNQAAPNQNQARIVQVGDCLALATSTANTNKAIAVGDPLTLDGAGNLTSAAANPGTAGTVVGFAKQALAGGVSTPTLIAVTMGGY